MNFLKEYIKYVSGGWLVGFFEILLTIILTEHFNIWFIHSYFIALLIGMVVLFFFHNNITFNVCSYNFKRMMYFIFFMVIMTLINLFGVYLLALHININYVAAILIMGVFTSVGGFTINKKVLFKKIEKISKKVKFEVEKGMKQSVQSVKKMKLYKK